MDSPVEVRSSPVARANRSGALHVLHLIYSAPWWLVVLIVGGLAIARLIIENQLFSNIFRQLQDGVSMTLTVSLSAYGSALVVGLIIGLIRANPPQMAYTARGLVGGLVRLVLYHAATLYVQVMRGLPILVTLLIVAFVVVPAVNRWFETALGIDLGVRGSSPTAAIIALSVTYAAFLSETFRAGIQSIGRGQIEAARSLGMNYFQVTRYIILPQAIRRVLPPLGNDMIAMIKDSSLVAILGVRDITQLAKLSSSTSFRYFETYLIAAAIYLVMTVLGSMLVRYIERRFPVDR